MPTSQGEGVSPERGRSPGRGAAPGRRGQDTGAYLVTLKMRKRRTHRNTEIPRGDMISSSTRIVSMIPPQTTKQSNRLKRETKYACRPKLYIFTSISQVNRARRTLFAISAKTQGHGSSATHHGGRGGGAQNPGLPSRPLPPVPAGKAQAALPLSWLPAPYRNGARTLMVCLSARFQSYCCCYLDR